MATTAGMSATAAAQYEALTQPATTAGVDPLALQGVAGNLLTFQSTAQEDEAASEGSLLTAAGADAEAAAYGTAAGISEESQRNEAVAESVRQIQIMRNVDQTVGGISASVAGNGFTQSGSALDIMRSSMQQGYLSQQISGLQSEQTQRGYMEQAAAANGEMTAAQVRGDAARLLSEAQASAGASATANQAALTNALTQLLAGDPNAQKLINDLTAGDIAGVQADALLYNPNGSGNPLGTVPGTGAATTGSTTEQAIIDQMYSLGTTWGAPNLYGNVLNQGFGLVQSSPDNTTNVKFVG